MNEQINQKTWNVLWTVEKYLDKEEDEIQSCSPDEVIQVKDNILLTTGITALLGLLTGDSNYGAYNNANAKLWVGDSSTGESAGQTDLQASSNKTSAAMDSTYPQVSGASVTFKSTFGTSAANYVWNEVGVSNGGTLGTFVKMLNRKVVSLGTKTSSATWILSLQITIS